MVHVLVQAQQLQRWREMSSSSSLQTSTLAFHPSSCVPAWR